MLERKDVGSIVDAATMRVVVIGIVVAIAVVDVVVVAVVRKEVTVATSVAGIIRSVVKGVKEEDPTGSRWLMDW